MSRAPLSHSFDLRPEEVQYVAIRAQGAGGQNVNKVSNAVQLRFDIRASSLPDAVKQALLVMHDQRITTAGEVVIKAQQERSLERNRALAFARLHALVSAAAQIERVRHATRPTLASQKRRVESKILRSRVKAMRGKVQD